MDSYHARFNEALDELTYSGDGLRINGRPVARLHVPRFGSLKLIMEDGREYRPDIIDARFWWVVLQALSMGECRLESDFE